MAKPARDIVDHIRSHPSFGDAIDISERTRRGLTMRHAADPERFAGIFGLVPVHIEGTEIEIDTTWQPSSSSYELEMVLSDYHAFFGDGNLNVNSGVPFRYQNRVTGAYLDWVPQADLFWSNDNQEVAIVGQSLQGVPAQVNDDKLFFPGVYGPGIDYQIELQAGRLKKTLTIADAATLGAPPAYVLAGENPVLVFTLLFNRTAGVTIWVDGVQWAEGNGQSNGVESFDYIEFRDSTNQVVYVLDKPYARDFGVEGEVSTAAASRFWRQGGSYFLELRVPWSWLETAVFPVILDPTVNPAVGTAADDVSESAGGLVEDSTNRRLNTSFPYAAFRIALSVPQDATVNDSYLSIFGDHPSLTDLDSDWDMVAEDNCAAWTTGTGGDVSGRTLTGNAVDCSVTLSASAYVDSATSATAALEALFARAGWSSGNYGGVVLTYKGSTGNAQYSSYDDSASEALQIFIDYSTGGGGGENPWNAYAQQ